MLENRRVLALKDNAALPSIFVVRLTTTVILGPGGIGVRDLAIACPLLRDLVGERRTRHPFHSVVGALTAAHVVVLIEAPWLRVGFTIRIFVLGCTVMRVGRHTDLVSCNERCAEDDSSGQWLEH